LGIDLAGINRNAAASPRSLIERGTRWFKPRRGCGPARRCGWAPAGSSRPKQTLGPERQALRWRRSMLESAGELNQRRFLPTPFFANVVFCKVISCKVIS
jgi:hypothetical protein